MEHVTGSGGSSKIIEQASVKFEAAVNEREINEQQRHSAALFQQYAQQRPLADIDEVEVPQPDEVRESMAAVAASSHELKCGQKIPAESLVVTRGIEIFVKSKYRGGGRHQARKNLFGRGIDAYHSKGPVAISTKDMRYSVFFSDEGHAV